MDHPEQVIIRPGRASDIEAIARIQSPGSGASRWEPSSYLNYDLTVAELNSHVVGFLVARQVCDGECEVLNLAVAPEFRRRGVARRLLRSAIRDRSGDWLLEVRVSNFPAIAFYRSEGFQQVGLRRKYYSQPDEDAVVMRKTS